MNRPVLFITVALITGMVAAGISSIHYIPAICLLIPAIVIWFFLNKKYHQLIFPVFFLLGAALFSFQNTYIPQNDIRLYMAGAEDSLTAVKVLVKDDPEFNENRTYFNADIISVFEKGKEISNLRGRTRVTLENKLGFKPQYGDIIFIKAKLRTPLEPKNPGEFDYGRFLKFKQIYYTVYAVDSACEKRGSKIENPFKYHSYRIKDKLLGIIYFSIPEAQAKIMNGIMLGNQRVIPDDIYDRFKITGTVHILAVSGMNVGLIALFVFLMLKLFRVKRKAAALITLLFITLFAVITGAGASIVRATIMGYVVLIGLILEKDVDLMNSLSIAAFILLLLNPSYIYDVGFQLSFLATFGIIYFITVLEKYFEKIPKWLSVTLASTVAAQVFLNPVMANTFHQVSLISMLANIFIVPLSGLISILGFAMWLFGSFSIELGRVFGAAVWVLIKVMMIIVDVFAAVPYAAISIKTVPLLLSLLYYIFFLTLPYPDIDIRIKKSGAKVILGVVMCAWLLFHIFMPETKASFHALSAKGVNAALFISQDNRKVLLLGCDDYRNNFGVKNVVVPFLRYKGINNIDELALFSMENRENIGVIEGNFMVKSAHADAASAAGLSRVKNLSVIDGEFYVKEGKSTFITYSINGADITFGDKNILFVKAITPEVEKRSGSIIYTCGRDMSAAIKLAGENICVLNSANTGFYRKPPPVEAANVWDLSVKGAFKYP